MCLILSLHIRLEPVESVAPVEAAVLVALVVPKRVDVRVFGQDQNLPVTIDRKKENKKEEQTGYVEGRQKDMMH